MAAKTLIAKLPVAAAARSLARPSPLVRLRPLVAGAAALAAPRLHSAAGFRLFSSRPTTSSLNDPSPNWSNRPPKETILLDGCDFEHWLIVMEPPDPNLTRDEIIDSYIKTLAEVLGSEQEARMSIYSVSTKHYFAFGCKVTEEISYKIKPLPKVRWVLPDSYLDVKNKDYGGEPFIDGQAVPYDPKYHEEWVRNNARAQERNRRNDRPRNFDRSRNFDRRRENMQNYQNRDAPPNQNFQNSDSQGAMPPRESHQNTAPAPAGGAPPGGAPNYQNQMPNAQRGFAPSAGPGYQNAQSYQGGPPPSGPSGYQGNGQIYQGVNAGGHQGGAPNYQGGNQGYQAPNAGYQGGPSGYNQQGGYNGQQGGPSYNQQGQSGYQGGNQPGGYQGAGYQGNNYQGGGPNYQQSSYQGGRDIPGRD